jgi:hypothetical protein
LTAVVRNWLATIAWRMASKFEDSLLVVIMAHPCRTAVLVVQYTNLVPAASIAPTRFRQAEGCRLANPIGVRFATKCDRRSQSHAFPFHRHSGASRHSAHSGVAP